MSRLVYIHGMGEQPPKAVLKHDWDNALFTHPTGISSMAYYADLRKGAELSDREQFLLDLGPLMDEITRGFTKLFLEDVYQYLYEKEDSVRIRARLRAELEKNKPSVLVAHSLGTIIAYEVLLAWDYDLPLFVTIGSPLPLESVKAHLKRKHGSLKVPGCIRSWHNFSDRLDRVALDATIGDDFDDLRIVDHHVKNTNRRENFPYGPHSGTGYLETKQVRDVINYHLSTGRRTHASV